MAQQIYLSLFFLTVLTTNYFHAQADELRFGATLPLSGNAASYGKRIRDGIELARQTLATEGIEIKMFYEDVPTPGMSSVTAIRKLLDTNNIDALVGNFFNGNIPAMAPSINERGILAFHTAIADDQILEAGDKIFSTNGTIHDEAGHLAFYARSVLQAKRAAIVYVGTNFGAGYANHFSTEFRKLGGQIIISELTQLGETDHRSPLLRIRQLDPDVLILAHFGTDLGAILKQIVTLRIETPMLSVYEAEDKSVVEIAGRAAMGLRFFVPEPEIKNSEQLLFEQSFFNAFGYKPGVFEANAYDATILCAKALRNCNKNADCAAEKIYKTRNYSGMSGRFTMTTYGAARRDFTLKGYQQHAAGLIEPEIIIAQQQPLSTPQTTQSSNSK